MSGNINFSPLTSEEIERQLKHLAAKNLKILVWTKGSSEKEEVVIDHYNNERNRIFFKPTEESKTKYDNKKILFSYALKGVHFFGQGDVIHDKTLMAHVLTVEENLYKCERRVHFRLLTYPHIDVRCIIDIDKNYDSATKTKVLDFTKPNADTNLFKDFIALVDEGQPSTNEEQLVFRVQDISVSGLALVVGALEKDYFEADKKIKDMVISAEGNDYIIPEARIVYLSGYQAHNNPDLEQYKVGIHFEVVPGNVDSALGKFINANLKESDIKKVFEDFLK